MPDYLKPHTPEWFNQLEKLNSQQAQMTKQIIALAGKSEVCSVCGDEEAQDFKIKDQPLTLRLCDDCRSIREAMHGEIYIPLEN